MPLLPDQDHGPVGGAHGEQVEQDGLGRQHHRPEGPGQEEQGGDPDERQHERKGSVHGVDEVHLLWAGAADADHAGQVGRGRPHRRDGGPAGGGGRFGGGQDLDERGAAPVKIGAVRGHGRVDALDRGQVGRHPGSGVGLYQDVDRLEDPRGNPAGFEAGQGGVGGAGLGQGRAPGFTQVEGEDRNDEGDQDGPADQGGGPAAPQHQASPGRPGAAGVDLVPQPGPVEPGSDGGQEGR